MAKAAQKVTLSPSRDIPFDQLVLSQSNVRRIKAGVSVEELAEDIARRGRDRQVVSRDRKWGCATFCHAAMLFAQSFQRSNAATRL